MAPKKGVTASQGEKITADAHCRHHDGVMTVTLSTELASTLDRVQWSLDSFNNETRKVKGDLKYLEAKVEPGFRAEGVQRKKMCDNLDAKK